MRIRGFTLIELMFVVTIIGVLTAIAIPTYETYVIRARVSEGLSTATRAKIAISEFFQANKILPTNPRDTGYSPLVATNNVVSILIDNNAIITITYTPAAGGGTIILVPTLDVDGHLTWSCTGGSLSERYRPADCRP